MQTEFWDAVNFRRGANPPRAEWKEPGTRPASETEQAFHDFEQYVQFIKAQPGARFVTATELLEIYADTATARTFSRQDLLQPARAMQKEITFQQLDGYALSAADVFGLLTDTMAGFIERKAWPSQAKLAALDGPVHAYVPPIGGTRSSRLHLERLRAGDSRDLRLLPDVPPPARRDMDRGGEHLAG